MESKTVFGSTPEEVDYLIKKRKQVWTGTFLNGHGKVQSLLFTSYNSLLYARTTSINYSIRYLKRNVFHRHYLNNKPCGYFGCKMLSRMHDHECTYYDKGVEQYLRHSVEYWRRLIAKQPELYRNHVIYKCLHQLCGDKYVAQKIIDYVNYRSYDNMEWD